MANKTMEEESNIELITQDETVQEYDVGDAPMEEEDEDMENPVENDEDEDRITADDADVRDDAEMIFEKHEGPVYAISVHPNDSRIILTGGGDDQAVIWNRTDGDVLHTLSGHTDSVVAVQFSYDGKYAATGGYDGIVKIWDVSTGAVVQTLEGPSQEIEWIAWHQKGYVILAGSSDGTVWMWLATTGDCMHVFAGHEDSVSCGSFTGSGKMIVSGSADGSVRMWNPKTGECSHVFRGGNFHEGPVVFLTCHPSQPLMLCGSQDGSARLVQLQAKRVLAAFSHDVSDAQAGTVNDNVEQTVNSVECGGFCTSMNWAATGCLGGYVRIWDLSTYQCRHVLKHPAGVTKLMWHPTVPIIYSSTVEGLIYVWDARTGEQLKMLAGHTDMVLDMALVSAAPNDPSLHLLTGSDDTSLRLFRLTE